MRAWAAAVKSGKVPPTSPGERKFPLIKGQGEWKILSASSEEPDTGFAHFAIDGNPDTYWHTSYTNGLPGFPHSIAVDMGTRMKFTGFIYTPRMDKDKGLISQYTFSVSDDGQNWKEVKKASSPTIISGRTRLFSALTSASLWRPAISSLTPGLR